MVTGESSDSNTNPVFQTGYSLRGPVWERGLPQAHQGSRWRSSDSKSTRPFSPLNQCLLQVSAVPHIRRQLVSRHISLLPIPQTGVLSGHQALTQAVASLLQTLQVPKKRSSQGQLGNEGQEATAMEWMVAGSRLLGTLWGVCIRDLFASLWPWDSYNKLRSALTPVQRKLCPRTSEAYTLNHRTSDSI